jgi:AcrR family transcriptional regulator
MKTKALIMQKACELFNARGLSLVSLREIAQALDRSYGNITYHFPSKERLVTAIYVDMVAALAEISQTFLQSSNLLIGMLDAPARTFEVSMRYIFLYRDYVEVMRTFPKLANQVQASNLQRKQGLMVVLHQLQASDLLRKDLNPSDLDYLMELSGAMRTFFFLQLQTSDLSDPRLKHKYMDHVNRLLLPYLSPAGRTVYDQYCIDAKSIV